MELDLISLPRSKSQVNKFILMLTAHLRDINLTKNKKEKSRLFINMINYLNKLDKVATKDIKDSLSIFRKKFRI